MLDFRRIITGSIALFVLAACGGSQTAETPQPSKQPAPQKPEAAATPLPSFPPVERTKAEWPQWRGPDRSGVSSDTNLKKSWPEGGPPLLWIATELGKGFSSVAISDGILYTLGERDDAEWVVAVDTGNGKVLWTKQIGPEYDNDKGGGPRSTPTIVGDRLYALGVSGDLHCMSTKDGEPIWHVNILEEGGGENLKWGISESPLVDGDHVIVVSANPAGSIVAFDRHTGKPAWRAKDVSDGPSYASGIVADVGGVRQILHFTDSAALGVRASDGKQLWRYGQVANDTANCTTPIYRDGHVFYSSGYDTGAALLALTTKGDETEAKEVYFTRDMMNHHGGVVLVGDHVYGFSNSNLACLDFKTGKELWKDRSVGKGSITSADGMLYLFSEKGVVGLARATPEGYQEVSRFEIVPDGKTWAHPVVAGGRMYLRNRNQLLCYDVGA